MTDGINYAELERPSSKALAACRAFFAALKPLDRKDAWKGATPERLREIRVLLDDWIKCKEEWEQEETGCGI